MKIENDIVTTLLKVDIPNRNGVVYTRESLQEAIKNIKPGVMYGTIGGCSEEHIPLEKSSHVITKIKDTPQGIFIEARILNTAPGKILRSLLQSKEPMCMGRRGVGKVIERDGEYYVEEYTLHGIDFLPGVEDI